MSKQFDLKFSKISHKYYAKKCIIFGVILWIFVKPIYLLNFTKPRTSNFKNILYYGYVGT